MFVCNVTDSRTLVTILVRETGAKSARAERELAAICYRVAAQLETIAGKENHDYVVDASGSREGLIRIELVVDSAGFGACNADMVLEIAIEACYECNLSPDESGEEF